MKKTIGIVGMGVSGLAVLLALSHQSEDVLATMEIFCFDDSHHFGKGIPFQEDAALALINSPIDDISFDYRNMSDFMVWLRENGYSTDQSYVARALYGKYLSERAKSLLNQLPVRVVTSRVEDIHYFPQQQQWQVELEEGATPNDLPVFFDEIHLACGALPVLDPYELEGALGYHADPYPLKQFARDEFDGQTVAVIGTGLAAIDVIKWLVSDTKASIQAFSRSNVFPTVRILEGPVIDWQFFTDETLNQLLNQAEHSFTLTTFDNLLSSELQALGFKSWKEATKQVLAPGQEGIALAFEHPKELYLLQQLASRITVWLTDLWPYMSLDDRKAYQDTYGKAIVNLRNPMPDDSAKVLLEAFKQNKLKTIADVSDITSTDQGFTIITKSGKFFVNHIINATGYHLTPANLSSATPLLQSLINQRLCQLDAQGGLTILPETAQVLSPKYGVMPNLYAHGALVNGVIYQNNSTIKIQRMAERAFKGRG